MSKNRDLLYVMNPSCGWCKKADPVVDELLQEGYDITTLNVKNEEDSKRVSQVTQKYGIRCGTPLFVDASSGNMVCGFKPKEVLVKWANGEEIPKQQQPKKEMKNMERLARLDYIWYGEDGTLQTKTKYDKITYGDQSGEENKGISFEELFSQIPSEVTFFDEETVKLNPVKLFPNPLAMNPNQRNGMVAYLIYCETFNMDDTPHASNKRYNLRTFIEEEKMEENFSATQQYMFWDAVNNWPSSWKWDETEGVGETPDSDKNYFCSVGIDTAPHRPIADMHSQICLQSGLHFSSFNAESMKSKWSYSLLSQDLVSLIDELTISNYLLIRSAESRGVSVDFSSHEDFGSSIATFSADSGYQLYLDSHSDKYDYMLDHIKESTTVETT